MEEPKTKTDVLIILDEIRTTHERDYHEFLNSLITNNDKLITILITKPYYSYTKTNPFSVEMIMCYIIDLINSQDHYGLKGILNNITFKTIKETRNESDWIDNFNSIIELNDDPVVIFNSLYIRTKFINTYKLKNYSTRTINICNINKHWINSFNNDNKQQMKGCLKSVNKQYPAVVPTVDIATTFEIGDKLMLLVGLKSITKDKYNFIGGFADPTDLSLEESAKRELEEETCIVADLTKFVYVGSRSVDNWRYRELESNITTTLFHVHYNAEEYKEIVPLIKASDDIEEVMIVDVFNVDENKFTEEHIELLRMLRKKLNK